MTKNTPLKVLNISKSFTEKPVLSKVSLSVNPGDIYGFVGLNGMGKTTLIKIILDLLERDSGEIELFGEKNQLARVRKNIAYLPEKFQPSIHLKGKEFLGLTVSYYGKKLDMKKAEDYATRLALRPEVLKHKITKYSKGMSQKLGLIGTLLTGAPLLSLDEPMSGLDPLARIQLKRVLLDYAKQGHTIFFTSHILVDIEEICNNIAVLHDGKIIFTGTPAGFKKKFEKGKKGLEHAYLNAIGVA